MQDRATSRKTSAVTKKTSSITRMAERPKKKASDDRRLVA